MELAIVFSVLKVLITMVLLFRPKRMTLRVLNYPKSSKEQIAKLPYAGCPEHIRKEIRLFNRMRVVMPGVKGIPNLFIKYLGRLYDDPRYLPCFHDAYQRVIYLAAATNLSNLINDDLAKRQLQKNMLYTFVAKNLVKKEVSTRRISDRKFFPYPQMLFHYMNGKVIERDQAVRCFSPSYVTYSDGTRHYVDKELPIECFEVKKSSFTIDIGVDKFACKVTHTADTLYVISEQGSRAIYCPDVKTFGTNLAGSGEGLKVNVTLSTEGKVFVVRGETKQELIAIVSQIRNDNNQIVYLLNEQEKETNFRISKILHSAHLSRFITGEKLQSRFLATQKLIPTLRYKTLVYTLESPSDFFFVIDNFELFARIAETRTNINIVFLYSSLYENMQNLIDAFSDREEAKQLIESGIFIFFIDKAKVSQDIVYYLARMAKSKKQQLISISKPISTNKNIIIEHEVSKSFPVKHSLFLINNAKKSQRTVIHFPIVFESPVYAAKKDGRITVLTASGNSSTYRLPSGAEAITIAGKMSEHDVVTDKILVQIETSLEGHQEKSYEIIKNDGVMGVKQRREAFIGALENIKVSGSPIGEIVARQVIPESDPAFMDGLKLAIRNLDEALFYACFAGREQITEEVYNFILQKIIGLKLAKGKINVQPQIVLTGDFELSFTYKAKPYKFFVRKHKSGFAIKHNEQEFTNFLQVSV